VQSNLYSLAYLPVPVRDLGGLLLNRLRYDVERLAHLLVAHINALYHTRRNPMNVNFKFMKNSSNKMSTYSHKRLVGQLLVVSIAEKVINLERHDCS
jgi:hypothetical protein